jgi:hypothetical protein
MEAFMGDTFGHHEYFLSRKARPIIDIGAHSHVEEIEGEDVKVENARIQIEPGDGAPFDLFISLSKEDLKRLIVAGLKFLKTGKRAAFYDDDFCIGVHLKIFTACCRKGSWQRIQETF